MPPRNNQYVTLVSSEGFEFAVIKEATFISPFIKSALNSEFSEGLAGRIDFPEINAVVLEKIVEYFHYWYKNLESADVPDMYIPVELCLEMLMAADFLGLDKQS